MPSPLSLPEPQEPAIFAELFPERVGAASLWLSGQVLPLFPDEAAEVRHAVGKRKAEFAGGRHCARLAMAELGRPALAVPRGPDRAPIWPAGLVGSITHSEGFCAAAVADAGTYRSIGIDSQGVGTVTNDIAGRILRPDEAAAGAHHRRGRVDWPTLHFCVKEAAYKAFYPVWRVAIGFQDLRLSIDTGLEIFSAEVALDPSRTVRLQGAYALRFGYVHSACWVASGAVP